MLDDEQLRRVELLEHESRWQEAMTECIAIAASGGGGRFLVRAADAALEAGWTSQAESLLREAMDIDPPLPEARFSLGFLLQERGDLEEARVTLEDGLRLSELQPVLTVLGSVYRRLGQSSAAETTLRRSLALDPDDDEAHYGLGLSLMMSDPVTAITHFRAALKLDSEMSDVDRELGHALWKVGKLEEAEDSFERAVQKDPTDAWAFTYLGRLKGLRNDWRAALEALNRAVELSPECGFFWASLAKVHMNLASWNEAERCFLRGLEAEIDEPQVNAEYGLYLRDKGFLTKARFYLRRAIEIDPVLSVARQALEDLDRT